jgi:hypothetical protein
MSGEGHRKTTSVTELVDYIATDESNQAVGYFVSEGKGSDTTGDGSLFNPFKTINAAITAGIANGDSTIQIVIDPPDWYIYCQHTRWSGCRD